MDYLGYGRNLPIQAICMSFFDKKQLTPPASVRFGRSRMREIAPSIAIKAIVVTSLGENLSARLMNWNLKVELIDGCHVDVVEWRSNDTYQEVLRALADAIERNHCECK